MTLRARRRATAGLRVAVTDGKGLALKTGPAAGLGAWLRRAVPRTARGSVAIAIITDTAIRRLNRSHRGVDRATDVLSFPAGSQVLGFSGARVRPAASRAAPNLRTRRPDEPGGPVLGDIAIASGVAARQARERDHSRRTELRILALHGLLHLLGYDHEGDHGEMQRMEERLRRRAGLPAGLIARTTRSHRPRP